MNLNTLNEANALMEKIDTLNEGRQCLEEWQQKWGNTPKAPEHCQTVASLKHPGFNFSPYNSEGFKILQELVPKLLEETRKDLEHYEALFNAL